MVISSTGFIKVFNIVRPDWQIGISAFPFVSCEQHSKKKNQSTVKQREKI